MTGSSLVILRESRPRIRETSGNGVVSQPSLCGSAFWSVSWLVAKLPAEQLLCARRWGEGIFGQSGQKAPALHLPRFPRPGWRKTLPLLIILKYSHLKAKEAQVRRCTWCLWRWASSALATKFFVVFVLDTWTHQTLLVAQGRVRESRLQDLKTKIWDQESEKLCDNSSNWSS